jgi:nicotinate-nucleotide adenylyltransferase
MNQKRIGIFGGTFNPVHNGHLNIVNAFLGSGLIDEVWVLPSYDPPHKTHEPLLSFEHRFKMAQLAWGSNKSVKVLDLEKKLTKPNFTVNTLTHLYDLHPGNTFFVCIGSDSLEQFHTWHEYQAILHLAPLLVASRPGYDAMGVSPNITEYTSFVDVIPSHVSSTGIRNDLVKTRDTNDVPSVVLRYILANDLYSL